MSKAPPRIPTLVGERVVRRGSTRQGTVVQITGRTRPYSSIWLEIKWDDGDGPRCPKLCSQYELELAGK
jgi:hypothetical protein